MGSTRRCRASVDPVLALLLQEDDASAAKIIEDGLGARRRRWWILPAEATKSPLRAGPTRTLRATDGVPAWITSSTCLVPHCSTSCARATPYRRTASPTLARAPRRDWTPRRGDAWIFGASNERFEIRSVERTFRGDPSRVTARSDADRPWTLRSRHRRGCHADIPRGRVFDRARIGGDTAEDPRSNRGDPSRDDVRRMNRGDPTSRNPRRPLVQKRRGRHDGRRQERHPLLGRGLMQER